MHALFGGGRRVAYLFDRLPSQLPSARSTLYRRLLRFRYHRQSALDQAADRFGAGDLKFLHGYPRIDRRNLLIVHMDDLRLSGGF